MPEHKVLFIDACLEHFLGCQNESKILDYGHVCFIGTSFAHQATTDPQITETEQGGNLKMLGKPC